MTRGVCGLVGAGAVGPVLARLLRRAGWIPGGIASRDALDSLKAAAFAGGGRVSPTPADAASDADLLLLAVPDRAIAAVAAEIAAAGTLRPGTLVLHCSGALSSEVLRPLREAGAVTGSIHPLQTFAEPESAAERMAGTWLFFEGDDPGRIRAVAEDLGGRPVEIRGDGKTLYHAGAAAACNLALAMVDLGRRLMAAAGIPGDEALAALLPLVRGTVENLAAVGLPAALTGPVARGDVETVEGHLAAIAEAAPDLLAPYAAASLCAVRIATEKGTLAPEAAEALRTRLSAALRA